MNELQGKSLPNFPVDDLYKIGDLVNYDGPLLSLFSTPKNELYLFDWSDNDSQYNRWLVFKITLNQLIQYLNKNLSHYHLITTYFSDYIISVDLDNDLNYHNVKYLTAGEVPADYLPNKDVFHDDCESPHLERIKEFIKELEAKFDVKKVKEWTKKFNTGLAPETLVINYRKIYNREMLLAV